MANGVVRAVRLYNQPHRKGRLDVSKTSFYENFVYRDSSEPNIPGTTIPRLKLASIGPKIRVAFEDEVEAVEEAIRRERDRAMKAAANTKETVG